MKVSNRIKKFTSFYQGESHVYDLCCDHGLIGQYLAKLAINEKSLVKVVFNDQIETIIKSLENKLLDSDIPERLYSLTTQPAEKFKIETRNNFIVIAGIGGLLTIDILSSLKSQNLAQTNIVVCPHNNYFKTRKFIIEETNFEILKDDFVYENGIYYEYLYLSSSKQYRQQSLFPSYYVENPEKTVKKLILSTYQYFKKAQKHPLRAIMLHFFLSKYSAIIEERGEKDGKRPINE